jgi:flavin reductase (DIM6/NTAB) family NADH-FMN oxidoreductase RutF
MIILPTQLSQGEAYKLLIGSVLPRPIAWVSSMDSAGNLNLAPFSFFTVVASVPMTLLFCPQISPITFQKKDTWRNLEQVPEFVVNITNEDTMRQMNLSASELPYGQSEFEWAGVTPAPSQAIRVPRVAEAPISFECKLQRIVVVSDAPGGGAAVFGEVQCIHMRDDLYANGRVNLEALRPIGRLAGALYTRVTDIFAMARIPAPDGHKR